MVQPSKPPFVERTKDVRATVVFVSTAAAVALFVAFVPHHARSTSSPYAAVNGRIGINAFYNRASVAPLSKADPYGIATLPLKSAAGRVFTTSAYVRPTGPPGGQVCLALLSGVAGSAAPVQTKRECRPLAAGWNQLAPLELRTDASGLVYAQVLVSGADGGFEARPLAVVGGS
jgi:hypothetical protein